MTDLAYLLPHATTDKQRATIQDHYRFDMDAARLTFRQELPFPPAS
jgi:hypothetical protein